MRKLGLLVLPVLVMFFPSAANAAWQPDSLWQVPSPGHFGGNASFDKFNTGLVFDYGLGPSPPWSGGLRNSLDDGESWGAAVAFPIGALNVRLARDGEGNRIWVYSLSSTIVVTRTSPTGGPDAAAATNSFNVAGVDDIKVVANPAGDALISWTSKTGDAGVSFWAADEPTPAQPSTFWLGCDSTESPTPFLDPGRTALFLWTCEEDGSKSVRQIHSGNAHSEYAYSNVDELDTGSIVRGGQAPDGRSVLLTHRTESIPENSYGETTTEVLRYAARRAGEEFEEPTTLVGDADRRYAASSSELPVTADGRVLIGYSTVTNMPDPYFSCFPEDFQVSGAMAIGVIDADTAELSLTTSAPTSPGTRWDFPPRVAAGPDGRLAVAYGYADGCYIDPIYHEHILLALDGEHFEDIDSPYGWYNLGAFTFTARGQLFITALNPSWPTDDHVNFYDTSAPLRPATRPVPPEPTGSTASSGGGIVVDSKSTPATVAVTIDKLKQKGSKLSLTLGSNVAGRFSATLRNGKSVVAGGSGGTVQGIARLQIHLTAKANKRLKQLGRLKTSLTITFAPTNGDAPAPVTKLVTFKSR